MASHTSSGATVNFSSIVNELLSSSGVDVSNGLQLQGVITITWVATLYVAIGYFALHRLLRQADMDRDYILFVGPCVSGWLMLGKLILILSWPIWYTLAGIILHTLRLFRMGLPRSGGDGARFIAN